MKKFYAPAFVALLTFTACAPNVETRGHLKEAEWQQLVTPKQSTQDDVLKALGAPSTKATFGPETWYYISTRRESYAFFKPKIADGEVLEITFTEDGYVNTVQQLGRENARSLEISEKITPTEGHEMTFMEQLLGNLGRFNAPGTTPGNAASGGRKPGTGR